MPSDNCPSRAHAANREGDVFLDVGANVGAYTIHASAVARAQTYAFEPSHAGIQSLRGNVDLNHIADRVNIEADAWGFLG
jgi:FkbM family methyltransferase